LNPLSSGVGSLGEETSKMVAKRKKKQSLTNIISINEF
jgi:hypothetical protein